MGENRRNWSAEISAKTASRKLASDIILMSLQLGMLPTIENVKSREHMSKGKVVKSSSAYKISFSRPEDMKKLIGAFPDKMPSLQSYIASTRCERSCIGIPKGLIPEDAKDVLLKTKMRKAILNRMNSKGCKIIGFDIVRKAIKESGVSNDSIRFLKNMVENEDVPLPIKKIDRTRPETTVYDIEVPESGMFVGGLGPMVLHNSGGGVVWGMTAAGIAAKVLKKAGSFSETELGEYEKLWKKAFGKQLAAGMAMRKLYARMSNSQMDCLMGTARFLRLLNRLDMDFIVGRKG
jgi:hypothetical protein